MAAKSDSEARHRDGQGAQGERRQCRTWAYDELGKGRAGIQSFARLVHGEGVADFTFLSLSKGGRNWEGFGADPFLAGEAAYETILGLQSSGVQACAKHYINKCVHFSARASMRHVY